jgi:hypothetical protein
MIRNGADFEVTGRSGNTVALVEVKNLPHLTAASAIDFRQGLLDDEHAAPPSAYLLVVSQDRAFLWEPEQAGNNVAEPAASFPMRPVLRNYLEDALLDQHLRSGELDLAVLQWMSDVARGRDLIPSQPNSLAKFAERIRGGTVHGGPRL